MNIRWVDTKQFYETIIVMPEGIERDQYYIDQFLSPWQQMMTMVAGQMGELSDDPFSGARLWHWLIPNQLTQVPESLSKLDAVNAWQLGESAMLKAVESFASYIEQIPIESIEGWLILADPKTSDPIGRGYTGGVDWMQPRFVVQYSDPNDDNLSRLEGCIVHEMHHLIRSKVVPWNMGSATVADYVIHEGLAESFATTLFGDHVLGHYVTDFDDSELDTARTLISENLTQTGFDTLRAFIFGDYWAEKLSLPRVGMPTYGGYAIGYHIVQAYLNKTGHSIQSATFVPASQIVEESGYFG